MYFGRLSSFQSTRPRQRPPSQPSALIVCFWLLLCISLHFAAVVRLLETSRMQFGFAFSCSSLNEGGKHLTSTSVKHFGLAPHLQVEPAAWRIPGLLSAVFTSAHRGHILCGTKFTLKPVSALPSLISFGDRSGSRSAPRPRNRKCTYQRGTFIASYLHVTTGSPGMISKIATLLGAWAFHKRDTARPSQTKRLLLSFNGRSLSTRFSSAVPCTESINSISWVEGFCYPSIFLYPKGQLRIYLHRWFLLSYTARGQSRLQKA